MAAVSVTLISWQGLRPDEFRQFRGDTSPGRKESQSGKHGKNRPVTHWKRTILEVMDPSLRVNPKGVKDTGVEVSRRCGLTIRESATLVRCPVEKALADSGPSQSHSVNLGVMIPPPRTVDLWSAAEFGKQNYKGVINAAAFMQIIQ